MRLPPPSPPTPQPLRCCSRSLVFGVCVVLTAAIGALSGPASPSVLVTALAVESAETVNHPAAVTSDVKPVYEHVEESQAVHTGHHHHQHGQQAQAESSTSSSAGNRSTDESVDTHSGDAVREHRAHEESESGETDRRTNDEAYEAGGHEATAGGSGGSRTRSAERAKRRKYEKGYLSQYHKKEYHKLHKFYGNAHKGGEYHKYGNQNAKHHSHKAAAESGKQQQSGAAGQNHKNDGGGGGIVTTVVKVKPAQHKAE